MVVVESAKKKTPLSIVALPRNFSTARTRTGIDPDLQWYSRIPSRSAVSTWYLVVGHMVDRPNPMQIKSDWDS